MRQFLGKVLLGRKPDRATPGPLFFLRIILSTGKIWGRQRGLMESVLGGSKTS